MASDINVDDLNNINEAMGEQIKLANQLTNAWKRGSAEINRANQAGASFTSTFGKQMQQTGSVTKSLASALRTAAKDTKRFGKYAGLAAGALRGMAKATELAGKAGAFLKSSMIALTKSFINLNIELMLAPIKMTEALMKMSDEVTKARITAAQASEDLAKNFGADAKILRELASSAGEVESEFGNMFAFMSGGEFTAMGEMAGKMGQGFFALAASGAKMGKEMGEAAFKLNNMLEITEAGQKAILEMAITTGKTIPEITDEFVQQSAAMGGAVGSMRKVIAQDIGEIIGDVGTFGNITVENAAVIAGRLRSLGSDFKTLRKITDKFLNFDSAAQSAASLGQAFGIALNPMRMMQDAANDPIKNLENLRKSMFAAGQDATKMNNAQIRLLASQTGLEVGEAKLLFAQKNRGKSVKDLRKASEAQKTDAEKMQDAVNSLTEEFSKMIEVLTTGGIFDNLTKGFGDFMKSKGDLSEFQRLNESMYQTGMKLGEVFQRMVDAGFFDKIIETIMKIEPLVNSLAAPGGFFDMLMGGNLSGASKEFGRVFKDVFGMSVRDGIEAALSALAGMAGEMVDAAASALEAFFPAFEAGLTGQGTGAMESGFGKLFSAWGRFFKAIWPYVALLLGELFDSILDWIVANPMKSIAIGTALATLMFGPSFVVGAAGMLGAALTKVGSLALSGLSKAPGGLGGIGKKLSGVFSKGNKAADAAQSTAPPAGPGLSKKLEEVEKVGKGTGLKDVLSGMAKLTAIAGTAGLALLGAAAGLTALYKMTGLKTSEVLETLAVISAFAVSGGALAWAFDKANIGKLPFVEMIKGAAVLGVFMGILGAAFAGITYLVREAAGEDPSGVAAVMDNMVLIIGATALMLPVAAGLGIMLTSFPFGTAGVAILAAGFATLGSLGATLVASFVPAIEAIAAIKIEDPATFKIVSDAILSLMDVSARMIDGIGEILKSIKPTPLEASKGETMAGNIALVVDLVDAFMKNGVVALMEQMKEIASLNVDQSAIEALGAIGGIMQGIATLAQSMSQSISDGVAEATDNDDIDNVIKAQAEFAAVQGPQVIDLLGTVKDKLFTQSFFSLLNSMQLDEGKTSMLGNIAPIIQAMAGFMSALTPGEAVQAMQHVDNDDSEEFIGALAGYAEKVGPVLERLLPLLGTMIETVINAASTMITQIPEDLDPVKVESAANMMTAIMGVVGGMNTTINSSINSIAHSTTLDPSQQAKMMERINNQFGTMADGLKNDLMPAIKHVYEEFNKFEKPKGNIAAKAQALEAIMKTIETVAKLFGKGGSLQSTVQGAGFDQNALQRASNIIRDLMKITFTNKTYKSVEDFAKSMSRSRGYAGLDKKAGLFVNALDGAAKIKNSLYRLSTGAMYDVAAIDGILFDLNYLSENWIGDFLAHYDSSVWESKIEMANQLAEQVRVLSQEIATINTIVDGIPNIELKATIDDIEDNLKIVEEFTKIKDKPISLNFALDIHIEADKLAKAILKTETAQTHLTLKNTSTLI